MTEPAKPACSPAPGARRLASYACDPARSRGRKHAEPDSRARTQFARDRDRIIHCSAFRRLKDKTQVFVAHEGDHYRTRLTHSLEVAQIARSLARALDLDDDLAEAIALAHDLGHPPFAHAGEDQLQACMEPYGGFDHNVQTFRLLTRLERRYPDFEGLNLSWETLEGVVKHNGPVTGKLEQPAYQAIAEYSRDFDLGLSTFASAEAQVAALADDIAYNNHDVDDGLQAGLFGIEALIAVPLIGPAIDSVRADYPGLDTRMLRLEAVRRMIGSMVEDVIEQTTERIAQVRIQTADDVRVLDRAVVAFSDPMWRDLKQLRQFLFDRMYRHHRVNRSRSAARRIVRELFQAYMAEPDIMPESWLARARTRDEAGRGRVACDYIAGMTDRFAIDQHRRLFRFDELQ